MTINKIKLTFDVMYFEDILIYTLNSPDFQTHTEHCVTSLDMHIKTFKSKLDMYIIIRS